MGMRPPDESAPSARQTHGIQLIDPTSDTFLDKSRHFGIFSYPSYFLKEPVKLWSMTQILMIHHYHNGDFRPLASTSVVFLLLNHGSTSSSLGTIGFPGSTKWRMTVAEVRRRWSRRITNSESKVCLFAARRNSNNISDYIFALFLTNFRELLQYRG